jgi:hypothetical protein
MDAVAALRRLLRGLIPPEDDHEVAALLISCRSASGDGGASHAQRHESAYENGVAPPVPVVRPRSRAACWLASGRPPEGAHRHERTAGAVAGILLVGSPDALLARQERRRTRVGILSFARKIWWRFAVTRSRSSSLTASA